MKNDLKVWALVAAVMAATWSTAFAAGNATITTDLQEPLREMELLTRQGTTKGWDFVILDEGVAWTNVSADNYTGQLYYADNWTNVTFGPVEILSASVTSNTVVVNPTALQVSTAGVFVCQLLLDNGTDVIEAGRGTLTVDPSIVGQGVPITLTMDYIARDGSQPPTATIGWGGQGLTNVWTNGVGYADGLSLGTDGAGTKPRWTDATNQGWTVASEAYVNAGDTNALNALATDSQIAANRQGLIENFIYDAIDRDIDVPFSRGRSWEFSDTNDLNVGICTNLFETNTYVFAQLYYNDQIAIYNCEGTGSGTAVADDGGSNYTGTVINGDLDDITNPNGKFGRGFEFHGDNSDWVVGDNATLKAAFKAATDSSIAFWFLMYDDGSSQKLMGTWNAVGNPCYFQVDAMTSPNRFVFHSDGNGGTDMSFTYTNAWVTNVWHHVAITSQTAEGALKGMRFYFDGAPITHLGGFSFYDGSNTVQNASVENADAYPCIGNKSLGGAPAGGIEGRIDQYVWAPQTFTAADAANFWNGGAGDEGLSFLGSSGGDVALYSVATGAASSPDEGGLTLFIDPDNAQLNTDIAGEISNDDGAAWDLVTLVDGGPIWTDSEVHRYSGYTNFTGSGTAVVFRVQGTNVTDNGRGFNFHAGGLVY